MFQYWRLIAKLYSNHPTTSSSSNTPLILSVPKSDNIEEAKMNGLMSKSPQQTLLCIPNKVIRRQNGGATSEWIWCHLSIPKVVQTFIKKTLQSPKKTGSGGRRYAPQQRKVPFQDLQILINRWRSKYQHQIKSLYLLK